MGSHSNLIHRSPQLVPLNGGRYLEGLAMSMNRCIETRNVSQIHDRQRGQSALQLLQKLDHRLPVFRRQREERVPGSRGFAAVVDDGLLRVAAAAVVEELIQTEAEAPEGWRAVFAGLRDPER